MKNKLLIFAYLLLLTSCGTRKATTNKSIEKESSKVEVKAETETVTTTNTEINTVTIDTSTTNEIIIEPVDPLVEFTVNGKTYKNARITTKKVKAGVVKSEVVKVAKNEENKAKTTIKAKGTKTVAVKNKETERNNTAVTVFLIIGIGLVIGFFLWLVGKRFKKAQNELS